MASTLPEIYARMVIWAKDLVEREPKLKPIAKDLYRTNSYMLFIAVLGTQDDLQPSINASAKNDITLIDNEINKLIDKLLLDNNFTRDEFLTEDLARITQYLKLWCDVIANQ